jgi:hypothetical protein
VEAPIAQVSLAPRLPSFAFLPLSFDSLCTDWPWLGTAAPGGLSYDWCSALLIGEGCAAKFSFHCPDCGTPSSARWLDRLSPVAQGQASLTRQVAGVDTYREPISRLKQAFTLQSSLHEFIQAYDMIPISSPRWPVCPWLLSSSSLFRPWFDIPTYFDDGFLLPFPVFPPGMDSDPAHSGPSPPHGVAGQRLRLDAQLPARQPFTELLYLLPPCDIRIGWSLPRSSTCGNTGASEVGYFYDGKRE